MGSGMDGYDVNTRLQRTGGLRLKAGLNNNPLSPRKTKAKFVHGTGF
jgi:hypothetical protein